VAIRRGQQPTPAGNVFRNSCSDRSRRRVQRPTKYRRALTAGLASSGPPLAAGAPAALGDRKAARGELFQRVFWDSFGADQLQCSAVQNTGNHWNLV
jgi:hypothetical protein